LSKTLKEWGFKRNEYDPCVAHKTINGLQCTLIWHINDLKNTPKKEGSGRSNQGPQQEIRTGESADNNTQKVLILGMTLDYSTKVKVNMSMYQYVEKLLTELPSDLNSVFKIAAASHLLNVNAEAKNLSNKGQLFHHLVAIDMLCRRTGQDIQTAVAFLCTRVQSPDEYEYKNIVNVMKYFCGTPDLTLIIELGYNPSWWVDSYFAVNPDMKNHSGIFMTLRKGAIYTASTNQKLNKKL